MNRKHRLRSGQALVETVLLLPLLTLLAFGMLDFARVYYFTANLNNAAREGARHAVLNIYTGPGNPSCSASPYTTCPVQTDTAVRSAVTNELSGTGIGPVTVQICPPRLTADPTCPASTETRIADYNSAVTNYSVTVSVSYSFQLLTPLMGSLLGNPLTFTTTSVMRTNY
jgi:Flp pilus assembly protein TadG